MELSWFVSCRRFGSGSWLHAIPSVPCFQVESAVFRTMLCNRLLGPVPEARAMVRCVCGHPVRSDLVTGIHYFGQCSLCSDIKWRHGQVAIVLRALLAELKLDVEHAERAVWWSQAPDLRPFDVLYRERAIGSIWKGLDVGIADPTRTALLFSQTRQRWFRSGQAANWMA